METIELKARPEIQRIITAAFPHYRRHRAYLSTFDGKVNISSYWDGGSKNVHAIVELATMRTKPLPTSTHPYFDIARQGLANQQTTAVESDKVGNLYLTQLPAGYALVSAGTFRGKPATAHVWLPAESPAPGLTNGSESTPAGVTGQELVKQLWMRASESDGLPPDTKFAVFSDGNKFAKLYNSAMLALLPGGKHS